MVSIRTFEERELLQEGRSDEGVCETEEEAAEEQPGGADVHRVRLGTGEAHGRLWEPSKHHIAVSFIVTKANWSHDHLALYLY